MQYLYETFLYSDNFRHTYTSVNFLFIFMFHILYKIQNREPA